MNYEPIKGQGNQGQFVHDGQDMAKKRVLGMFPNSGMTRLYPTMRVWNCWSQNADSVKTF